MKWTEQLTDRQREILALLKNSALSPHEILINLKEKISDRTLRRDLQNLKEVGYVESEGQGKKLKWFLKPGHNPDITRTIVDIVQIEQVGQLFSVTKTCLTCGGAPLF
jgi:predicted HTH transcriptional regulator